MAESLYRSLSKVHDKFLLHCYIADDVEVHHEWISNLDVHVVTIGSIETEELLEIKKKRTKLEYFWTLAPHIVLDTLKRYPHITGASYLDADIEFLSSPEVIFDEAKDASVILSPYYPGPGVCRDNRHPTVGKYCVQFVYFKNDDRGLAALRWWAERCREWCFFRLEGDKFGDQKYLEQIPTLFSGVHDIQNERHCLGPWNSTLEEASGCVFYHHHKMQKDGFF